MDAKPLSAFTKAFAAAMNQRHSIWQGFMSSAERFPDQNALVADGSTLSYRELRETACQVAATIQAHPEYSDVSLTSIFAYRTVTAFAGVLGALLAGNGYVPLNRTFPIERTQTMFERSGSRCIVVDAESLAQLNRILDGATESLLIILPDTTEVTPLRSRWPNHVFVSREELAPASAWTEPDADADAIAYLLFTSGSTGTPKGVMVAVRNVLSFVEYIVERYQITENDRFSQMFDMTFDLAAFDMFVCWERGGCLYCPPSKVLMSPGRFIRDNELTIWFSVPSTAMFMNKLGMLKPGRYPSLRLSLFCGEPLPVSSARAWLEAAPNSTVENLYGPTELTISCTVYRWDQNTSPDVSEGGIVPIGYPHPGMDVLVVDQNLNEVAPGEVGELLMNGPQMSLGYWKDPERTADAFVVPPGRSEIYYRTGDRVRRPIGERPLTHLGRTDFQVKVLGHRVELGEIEAVVRDISGIDGVVAVGWPVGESGCAGIEVFVEGSSLDQGKLRTEMGLRVPEYMIPRRIHFFDQLPRNSNGKYDRKQMIDLLENGI